VSNVLVLAPQTVLVIISLQTTCVALPALSTQCNVFFTASSSVTGVIPSSNCVIYAHVKKLLCSAVAKTAKFHWHRLLFGSQELLVPFHKKSKEVFSTCGVVRKHFFIAAHGDTAA